MLVAWLAIHWMAPGTKSRAFVVGVWWLVLTITFEFVAGPYLFGDSWDELLVAYDMRLESPQSEDKKVEIQKRPAAATIFCVRTSLSDECRCGTVP
jgi:hypothetical protein